MRIALFIIVNLIVFSSHYLLAYMWMRHRGRSMSEVILGGALSALTQIVVTLVILGLLIHRLYVPEIFWTNVLLCIVFLAIARVRLRHLRNFIVDLWRWIVRFFKTTRRDAVLCATALIFFLLFIWLLFIGILLPPYSWDPMSFHLAYPAQWLQDGRMGLEPSNYDTYPRNISVIYFWELVFLRRDIIINCTNLLLFIPMGILAIYVIGRRIGLRRGSALLAGLLFATFPNVIHQATTCYIDLAISCIFLASIAFLLKPRIEFSDVVYAGLGLGLFVGSKGNAPIFAIGALIPAIIYHIPHLWRMDGFKRFVGWILTGLMLIMLSGSWVYIDNWVKHGNPGYPFVIKVFGKKLFDGIDNMGRALECEPILHQWYEPITKRSSLGKIYFSWSDPSPRFSYDMRVGGYGPVLFILMLPCLAASLLISLLRRDGRMFFTLATLLLAFWIFPYGRFWVRYTLFVGAAFCLSLVYIIELLRFSSAGHLLKGLTFALMITTIFISGSQYPIEPGVIQHFMHSPVSTWHSSAFFAGGYSNKIYQKIFEVTKPGTTIAYDWTQEYRFAYPLWNTDFSNRVEFIASKEETEWKRQLAEINPDFLLLGTDKESYKWVMEEPGKFQIIIRGPTLTLFRLIKDQNPQPVNEDDNHPVDDGV